MDQLSFPSVRVVEEYMNNFLLRAGDAYEKFAAKAKNTAWKDLIVDNKEAFGFLALSLIIGTVFSCRRKPLTIKNGAYNGCTTMSAPGKALVVGGYLVLDQENCGFTVGVSSRFYTTVKVLEQRDVPDVIKQNQIKGQHNTFLVIKSPQFHSVLVLRYDIEKKAMFVLSGHPNEFIEKTIWLALLFIQQHHRRNLKDKCPSVSYLLGKTIGIKLRAHNDFYSQIDELSRLELPRLSSSLAEIPAFNPNPIDGKGRVQVAKTGLGSSAALTTSLVGALLQFDGIVKLKLNPDAAVNDDRHDRDLEIIHNLGQVAHSLAQGKVGSGFDVSSAVYGTQIYRRFKPSIMDGCMKHHDAAVNASGTSGKGINRKFNSLFGGSLYNLVTNANDVWDQRMEQVQLPLGVDIVMGDVHGGTNSPSMAKKVLLWKRENPVESAALYQELAGANSGVCASIKRLNKYAKLAGSSPNDAALYNAALLWCNTLPQDQWSTVTDEACGAKIIQEFAMLRKQFQDARRLLRTLGVKAGVGIEPASQTELIDASENVLGVLCAGVPGAGGIDALYVMVLSPNARQRVELIWSNWKGSGEINVVCPLQLHSSGNADNGVRLEELKW